MPWLRQRLQLVGFKDASARDRYMDEWLPAPPGAHGGGVKSILSVGSEVWDGPLLVKVANVRSALTEGSGLKRCFCVVSDYFQGLVR